MARLSASELEKLLGMLPELYAPCTADGFAERVLGWTERLLPSVVVSYNKVDVGGAYEGQTTPDSAVSDTMLAAFVEHIDEHPLIRYYHETRTTDAVRISDLVSNDQFHRLALYNEFFRPMAIRHQMAVSVLPGPPNLVIGVALNRASPGFTDAEQTMLGYLYPHLAQAYRNAQTLTLALQARKSERRELVVLVGNGARQNLTGRAAGWLAEYFQVPGAISGLLPNELHRWVAMRQAYFESADEIPLSTSLTRHLPGRMLTVRFLPGTPDSGGDLLVLMETSSDPFSAVSPAAISDLGLSQREGEVTLLAARGLTNGEIAGRLSVSPRTVQKHLENIFDKLEIHSRTALAARLYQAGQT